jgi:hypothetical protein
MMCLAVKQDLDEKKNRQMIAKVKTESVPQDWSFEALKLTGHPQPKRKRRRRIRRDGDIHENGHASACFLFRG